MSCKHWIANFYLTKTADPAYWSFALNTQVVGKTSQSPCGRTSPRQNKRQTTSLCRRVPHHRHGLHFVKMFPITKGHTQKFHTDNNAEYKRINNILDKNTRQIVAQAQAYLTAYEQGNRSLYATNIDKLLDYISK